jgi:hypothetical protein
MELRRSIYVLTCVALLFCGNCFAQNNIPDGIKPLLEEIAEANGNEDDDWADYLLWLTQYPLNLNSATREQLEKVVFLTPYQIENLHSYIYEYGQILTIYELTAVKGFDAQVIRWLSAFVTTEEADTAVYEKYERTKRNYGRTEMLARTARVLEKQKAYSDGKYAGSAWQVLTKYRYENNKLKLNLTYEKDAGEQFWDVVHQQPEYLSGSLLLQCEGVLKELILGDFRANFGQGLGLWQDQSFGKSQMVLSGVKSVSGFKRHTSALEYNFFRGAAATFERSRYRMLIFGSYKGMDASFENGSVTSMGQTGYHRTASEQNRRNALHEGAFGFRGERRGNSFKSGISYHSVVYDEPVFHFGNQAVGASHLLSADGLFVTRNFMLWGELAFDRQLNEAVNVGISLYPDTRFAVQLQGRLFHPDFSAVYSAPFSETGKAENEQGMYLGFEWLAVKGLKVQSYLDFFRFVAPRYLVDMPSSGADMLCFLTYEANRELIFSAKFKYKQKEKNFDSGGSTNWVLPYQKTNIRFEVLSKPWATVRCKSRVEAVFSDGSGVNEAGYFVAQDVLYDSGNSKWSIDGRVAFFSTGSFNTAVYAYEPDVLYAFSIPVYYGKGMRYLVSLNYKINNTLRVYLKCGQFNYTGQSTIGSGDSEINSNRKTDFKVQLIAKF